MIDRRESRATAASAIATVLFAVAVVALPQVGTGDFLTMLADFIVGALLLWFLVGVVAALLLLAKGARMGSEAPSPVTLISGWTSERWNRDRLTSLLWPPLLFAVLMAAYNSYKQRVLVEFGFAYDSLFTAIDRALFLGRDPWLITHDVFDSPGATSVLGHLYHGWYAPMSLGIMICAWLPATSWRLRTRYIFCYLCIWIVLGCGLASLFPATGPIFVPDLVEPNASFAALKERLAAIDKIHPLAALDIQALLLSAHHADGVRLAGGISAMPSVHNALAILFAIIAFQIWRPAGWLMAVYAVLIWIGSVHLGWHYAIDGLASLLLTLGLWALSAPVCDWLEGRRSAEPFGKLAPTH